MTLDKIIAEANGERSELLNSWAGDGLDWCRRNSQSADKAIRNICESAFADTRITVAAVGGYGREEIGPNSDLDIVFISSDDKNAAPDTEIKALFKSILTLSEGVGWDMDYALRFPSDIPALDDKSRTALLDIRFLAGNKRLFEFFVETFRDTFPTARFLSDKIQERKAHRAIHGISPRVVEFNLRDGPGGLRDYQTAKWFSRVLSTDALHDFSHCYERLWSVRACMQLLTNRKEDRLLRTRHAEIADRMQCDFQTLYTEIIQCAEAIQQGWEAAQREARLARLDLSAGISAVDGGTFTKPGATLSTIIAGICRAVDLSIYVNPVENFGHALGDGPACADMLVASARYLREIDRCGLLDLILTEWITAKYHLPDDSMHTFTIGEHTLNVVDTLDELKSDKSLQSAWDDSDHRTLYLAALLHDLGKIDRNRPHSIVGAEIARNFGERMSLQETEVDDIEWLVREHLTLARIARTHDLRMPAAPTELSKICGNRQRLSMLYLLTIADVRAVSPEAMTPHFQESLALLYSHTCSVIGSDRPPIDPAIYRSVALEELPESELHETMGAWLESMPSHYLIGTPTELFSNHFAMVNHARAGETIVVFENIVKSATTEITICCKDLPLPGLLSRILGVLYAHDLSVHAVRAASTDEPEAIALDQITTSFRGGIVPSSLSALVSESIKRCISSESELFNLLAVHNKIPDQKQRFIDHRFIDGKPCVLEIETPLGRGMPYRVTKMLASFGWNVYVARMGQWADRAVARFYLVDPAGPLSAAKVSEAIAGYR
jgi:[protein-PII] uridylyltransferase